MALEKDTLLHHRYRIIEILGQGGMGSVYRGKDENLGSIVAIKENLFTTEEYARQFKLEAVILANLRHPNLPRVYDHFVVGEEGQYLVMDFIDGEDLRQRMDRLGNIDEDDAVQIGASIADALSYLHSRKPPILHRDIKPGNVKITPEGHIYLVDFGLAKVYQNSTQATTTGARAMTPGYSPPEQYGTARTDPRTDVYSLGATLYAAISGVIPEDGLARAMDNAQLTPLRKRAPKISRRLAACIEKAMAVDPSDRFQTADEFKKVLLSSKSRTVQVPGGYTIAPPPADAPAKDPSDATTEVDKPREPTGPVMPPAMQEEQPFVSPLKKQKERERRRRLALIRFVLITILLTLIAVPFLAPGLLPDQARNMIPFLAPTATATHTVTPSPLPTQTELPTDTPTFTPAPTNTSLPTSTFVPSVTSDAPTALETPIAAVTPIGGGSGQIAYASSRSGSPQIYIADLASQAVTQITELPEGACQPDWSPDGTKIVFISPCKGRDEIYYNAALYIINADGSKLTPISTVPGGDFDPAWSPDGKTIAFTSMRSKQMEIYLYNIETQSVTALTKGASNVQSRQPAWSPDGSLIVYAVKRLGVYQIWLMSSSGENQQQIIRSGVQFSDYLPAFSTDGQLILFNQRCANTFCLPYLLSASSTDRSSTQGSALNYTVLPIEDVDYSPDGFWLAFEGQESGENVDIFIMTVTGANRVRLTSDPALDFDPDWRPVLR